MDAERDSSTDSGLETMDAACLPLTSPCFARFVAELATARSCLAHSDSCATSDATSSCGIEGNDGGSCRWGDGARIEWIPDDAGPYAHGRTAIATNASGERCFEMDEVRTTVSDNRDLRFPDGSSFAIFFHLEGPDPEGRMTCDGVYSSLNDFSWSALRTCDVSLFCCSAADAGCDVPWWWIEPY